MASDDYGADNPTPAGQLLSMGQYTASPKECHEWAVSRFGNGAGLFNVITNTGRNVFRNV